MRLGIVGKIAVQIDILFVSSRPMRKTPRIERMQRHHIHPRRDVQVAEKCDLKRRADKALLPMCAGHQEQSLLCIGIAERSEEHTSELQSLIRIAYAVFCLKKKKKQ